MNYATRIALGAACLAAPAAVAQPYEAEVRRTSFGIVHVKAANYGSIGYGVGNAFAQDNFCMIADEFVTAYAAARPEDEIEHWDLWDGSLPDFRLGALAKMSVFAGQTPNDGFADAWAAARATFERFDSADKLGLF